MKIAYISYEHPHGIGGGGIGTYTDQIAAVMANRGHDVEVFSSNSTAQNLSIKTTNYLLHLISYTEPSLFKKKVLQVFSERHLAMHFDLIESPEYGADALLIKEKYPKLPLVIKLHTPSFLVSALNDQHSFFSKARFIIGGLIKGNIPKPYWKYDKTTDNQYQQFLLADGVYSPSQSLKNIINKEWGDKEINVTPNPFVPKDELLKISTKKAAFLQITFLGRLEKRKGIIDLINAIPIVLNTHQIHFQFVGQALDSPEKGKKMDQYIKDNLKKFAKQLTFQDQVNYQNIPAVFENTDICVLPSLWENFPTVCLEAMAAGKVVIGTNNGGMSDMIIDGVTGILIPPNSPYKLAEAIKLLANNRPLIEEMGEKARKHLLSSFNSKVIGELTENFYRKINPNVS
ncbi:glycosyltransferase family 4 protein [Agrobacterium tumefaciens]|nr:glycosyltransferase family 4 protein [Agrobacterium tumefaciens]NTE18918.1 glycosyltransferase family 4 protein [Agrobacterium tumefaciens]